MCVVITGAQGFIGRKLSYRLASEGFEVVAVDILPPVEEPQRNIHYQTSDLSDPASLLPEDLLHSIESFVLVHLVWEMRSRNDYKAQLLQVELLRGLMETWATRNMESVIITGSAAEYGRRNGVIREDDKPVLPLSPYGWGKLAGYHFALSFAAETGIPLLWLRPFVVYGSGQSGDMLIPYALRQAAAGERADFTDGSQLRDFVHVDDIVEAILKGVRLRREGVFTVNLGRGEHVRVRDVVTELGRLLKAEGLFNLGTIPRRENEPDVQVADTSRAESVLGWRASIGWREGLSKLLPPGQSS